MRVKSSRCAYPSTWQDAGLALFRVVHLLEYRVGSQTSTFASLHGPSALSHTVTPLAWRQHREAALVQAVPYFAFVTPPRANKPAESMHTRPQARGTRPGRKGGEQRRGWASSEGPPAGRGASPHAGSGLAELTCSAPV